MRLPKACWLVLLFLNIFCGLVIAATNQLVFDDVETSSVAEQESENKVLNLYRDPETGESVPLTSIGLPHGVLPEHQGDLEIGADKYMGAHLVFSMTGGPLSCCVAQEGKVVPLGGFSGNQTR